MGYDFDAVVAGHICLDLTPRFGATGAASMGEIFVPGRLVNMGEICFSTGGPVSNTGVALHKLGVDVKLMGKIGKDHLGIFVLRLLSEIDAEECMAMVEGESTSYTVVIVPEGFDRVFLHNPGANDTFGADDIDYGSVARSRLFHFGYPPLMRRMYENGGEELIKIFKRVKALGVTTSLDMSLPDEQSDSGKANWEGILRRLLPYVDIFLPSVEEAMFFIDRPAYKKLASAARGRDALLGLDMNGLRPLGGKLLGFGAKIVAIKCGIKGYYITTANEDALKAMGRAQPGDASGWAGRELIEESFHVDKEVSATGAGDSSIAGFLSAYLRGMSIEGCIRTACCTGGQNVRAVDALSGIKSFEETQRMLRGWDKNRLRIEGGYFAYHPDGKVWAGKKDRRYGPGQQKQK
jgi:sugar/nucleoside kinase (ribokinase family)